MGSDMNDEDTVKVLSICTLIIFWKLFITAILQGSHRVDPAPEDVQYIKEPKEGDKLNTQSNEPAKSR